MTSYVTSVDGTLIAYDRLGQGPTVVLVSGMFCDRQTTRRLAEQLAQQFTVINYDRRGRGASGDTAPYAIHREIEDLAALIAAGGGTAAVYGHSSGAGLALNAAGHGLPITRLVLHEPPYSYNDQESRSAARSLADRVRSALASDRRAEAITMFLTASGVPEEMAEGMASDPRMLAVAPTMPYDFEVMGEIRQGGAIPEDLVRAIDVPALVIAGGASPQFFRDIAIRIAYLLPNGSYTVLEGQDHGAPAHAVAPVVTDFLTTESLVAR
jgi:pimeloyl-ACP methyl ester carboxylesterase